MNTYYVVDNIQQALEQRLFPSVTLWNRLEGRPRTDNFSRALRAEVRDALFMLTKQWQLGEFRGDDAGSPVVSKILASEYYLNKYAANGHTVQTFPKDIPLEAMVEQKKLPFSQGKQIISLDIRLMMGRHWLKLIKGAGIPGDHFIADFPFTLEDQEKEENAGIYAHRNCWQSFAAVAGRALDGYALYEHIRVAGRHSYFKPPGSDWATPAQKASLDILEKTFMEWYTSFFLQPLNDNNDGWMPANLEYQFHCSGKEEGVEKIYSADEYYHGHLDWYNLDIDENLVSLGDTGVPDPSSPDPVDEEFIPVPLSFGGMPNTRWWAFEDATTNFGDIKPDTTDLNKLLVMEFGLIYANDWFLFPLVLDTGTIGKVKGLSVTNVFGERIWIEAAGKGSDEAWQRWGMFNTSIKGSSLKPADTSIIFLPVAQKVLEGKPMEEVKFIRDEVANMVWGIESIIPLANGESFRGNEAGNEYKNYLQRLKDANTAVITLPELLENDAKISYQLMNTVPEHWIPFIPVHTDDTQRHVKLQRAAMPRWLFSETYADPQPVKPRTSLLREGMDAGKFLFINEEEVPRAGVVVTQSFQRTRWYGGATFNWFGARKQTGRGEGSSGLAFDRIIPKDNKTPSGNS